MDANQNRREFKFVLPPHLGLLIRERVGEVMQADRGAEDGYPVLSEYYDTTERSSYWQKQFEVPNRRRVRSRVYGRRDGAIPASAFIEVKHKLDGVTVKRRVPVDLDELEQLTEGVIPVRHEFASPADQRVLAEIAGLVNGTGSRPVVQIRYHRYAFDSGPEGTIRITFDNEPRCRFRRVRLTPDDPDFELPLLEPGSSIMEVKTIGPVPYWFRNLIGEFKLVPRGFSKYTAALELYEFKSRPPIVSPAATVTPEPPPARKPPRKTEAIPRKTEALDEKGRRRPAATTTLCRELSEPAAATTPGALRILCARLLSRLHLQKAR
ncbi:polyphosphate polymerase domain-containing protein [Luteolibacter flavescens]|uniref:Polyphosphate polymerase domain-containing protein n=1 Tax=Luteolibacter flavescens TaxID=1859460 RepID=A0ABT3FKI4_9BACT|nr:polyphosphate polymerase domain-containing protein [Luteolibacter flavescens]MCW1884060.1 polyphosphate polymerase domain-containing protein [Luteolibacter flavescens]